MGRWTPSSSTPTARRGPEITCLRGACEPLVLLAWRASTASVEPGVSSSDLGRRRARARHVCEQRRHHRECATRLWARPGLDRRPAAEQGGRPLPHEGRAQRAACDPKVRLPCGAHDLQRRVRGLGARRAARDEAGLHRQEHRRRRAQGGLCSLRGVRGELGEEARRAPLQGWRPGGVQHGRRHAPGGRGGAAPVARRGDGAGPGLPVQGQARRGRRHLGARRRGRLHPQGGGGRQLEEAKDSDGVGLLGTGPGPGPPCAPLLRSAARCLAPGPTDALGRQSSL
mmetsp:Transcript_11998/g.38151  ORF Transcript_11998/g.38151 Transcript_11998/m.38151 type:complete len:284 (+) Transcript_11998:128-979(+)